MSEPTLPPAAAAASRPRLALRMLWLVMLVLVLGVGVVLSSTRGLSLALHTLLPSLAYSELEGSLLAGVTLRDVHYVAPTVTLRAQRLALRGYVSVREGMVLRNVEVQELAIELTPAAHTHAASWPQLPFSVRVERARVAGLSVTQGTRSQHFTQLAAAVEITAQRLSLREFDLRRAQQQLRGYARYDAGGLDAVFDGQGLLAAREAHVHLRLRGALDALAVELQVQKPWLASLRGQLNARATPARFNGELSAAAPAIGPFTGTLDGGLAGLRLQLHLPLAQAAPALRELHLDFALQPDTDRLRGALRWRLGAGQDLHGDGLLTLGANGLDIALDGTAPATASVRARLLFEGAGARLGARLRWQDIAVPGRTPAIVTAGTVQLRGLLDNLFVRGDARAVDGSVGAIAAHWRGRLRPAAFELALLDSRVLAGRLRAHGSVQWQDALCTRVTFNFAALDFAYLDADLASSLAGLGRSHWCRQGAAWQGSVAMEHVAGRWRGQPLSARGEFEHTQAHSAVRKLRVELGGNVLSADVELAPTLGGNFSVDARELAMLLPSLGGRLNARGKVAGTLAVPVLRAQLHGAELLFGKWRAARVNGAIDIDAARVGASSLALRLNEVRYADMALGELSVHGQGTAAAHSLALTVQGGAFDGALEARGAWAARRWAGALTALTLEHQRSGPWQLQGAAPLSVAHSELALGPACVAQHRAKLCVTVPHWSARDGRAELHLRALPLALAGPWLPRTLLPRGSLSADATLSVEAGLWHGQGFAQVERGSVRYRAAGHADQDLPLRDAQASFALNGESLRATAKLSLGEWIRLQGTLDAGLGAHAPLRGELLADLPDIRWLEEFVPDLAGSEGGVHLNAKLSGARDAPMLSGELRLLSGSLLLPRFGTRLTALEINTNGALDNRLALSGQAQVGAGTVAISGEFMPRAGAGPRAQLTLRGEQLAVVRLPEIEADAAPDVELTLTPQTLDLHGRVSWSRVQIHLPSLPERAVATSPDEVVIDGAQGPRTALPQAPWFVANLAADVDFTLGDEVALSAAGLDARLTGAVHWHKPRGDQRGRGQGGFNIVDGHYKAYGQDLKIQRGALIFDGAIDNPTLEVRAIRADLDVTAGVRVSGNMRVPKFALFAEPSLPDAEVLSYLVTGHALANASSGEATVIARAALSLGADRAALVTSQLSNLFALDEFGINPGTSARTSAIVAGKRLTPKLTVRSEFNPFERAWSFFLNYKLAPRWSVEAQTGAGQGADVIYSVERDRLSGSAALKSDPLPPPPSP